MHFNLKKTLASIATASALFVFGSTSLNSTSTTAQAATSTKTLAGKNYGGKSIITVDHNKPSFKKSDLKKKTWQKYGNLDGLNRATAANALLNKSLMPTTAREALIWNPTGWHNKRIASGWLYNRCHLIGYQLTGQNNNPKNLITGTRQLNDPDMLKYENQVAKYIKSSRSHYVRYRVTPAFRGNELLARGVHMEGQSVGSNAVKFNVYIFNVQPGVKLNYTTGTSVVSKSARTGVVKAATVKKTTHKKATKKAKKTVKKVKKVAKKKTTKKKAKKSSSSKGLIVGSKTTKVYHLPGQRKYRISAKNRVYFKTEAQAKAAGYRKSLR